MEVNHGNKSDSIENIEKQKGSTSEKIITKKS